MGYAARTEVSSTRSLEQIKRLLLSVGAKEIQTAERSEAAAIQFELTDRRVRFVLPLPRLDEFGTVKIGNRRRSRTSSQALTAWEQATRAKWRALLACIKAKLVSAQSGIETVEEAFLANIVTSDGSTVWQDVVRKSADGYLSPPKGSQLTLPAAAGEGT